MWLHWVLLLYIAGVAYFSKNITSDTVRSRATLISVYIPLLALFALRSVFVGNDTVTYFRYFTRVLNHQGPLFSFPSRMEPAYYLMNKLLTAFFDDPQVLLIVCGTIIFTLYFALFKKYSPMPWLSLFLFVASLEYYSTMNTMRQCIAIAILALAYHFTIQKKPGLFISFVLLAASFHVTALVFLVVYPLKYLRISRKAIWIAAGVSLALFLGYDHIAELMYRVPWRFSVYIYRDKFLDMEIGSVVRFLINLVVLGTGWYYGIRPKTQGDETMGAVRRTGGRVSEEAFLLLTKMCILGTCVSLVAIRFSLLARVAKYFTFYQLLYIPLILSLVEDQKERRILLAAVMVCFLAYGSLFLWLRPLSSGIFPYRFFWMD